MAAPRKPWESTPTAGPSCRPGGGDCNSPPNGSVFNVAWNNEAAQRPDGGNHDQNAASSSENAVPPLPPRPGQVVGANGQTLARTSYGGGIGGAYGGGYGTPYNSFSSPYSMMGNYGGYQSGYGSGYGGYGSYGMGRFGGMGGYGCGPGVVGDGSDQNDFIRLAEESSRQAFQSIESIVHAFGSVSMMLESTYFAVHSSFRAVLGVAEHFSRMKGQFSSMVSSLAVIRTLHWFVRRLAYLLGASQINPDDELVWREASSKASEFPLSPEGVLDALTREDAGRGKSSWPILIFFAVVCGTPWLIWKLLSKLAGPRVPSDAWMSGETDHYLATGLYDFQSTNPKEEISFKAGQQILIAPRDAQPRVRGWLLATVDGKRAGLVPAPYLKVIGFKATQQQQSPSTPPPDPSVNG